MRGRGRPKRHSNRPSRYMDSPPEAPPLSPDEEVVFNFQNGRPSNEHSEETNVDGASPNNIPKEMNVNGMEQESTHSSPAQGENSTNNENSPEVSTNGEQIPNQQDEERAENVTPNDGQNNDENDGELSDLDDEAREHSYTDKPPTC